MNKRQKKKLGLLKQNIMSPMLLKHNMIMSRRRKNRRSRICTPTLWSIFANPYVIPKTHPDTLTFKRFSLARTSFSQSPHQEKYASDCLLDRNVPIVEKNDKKR